jgi:hypothetical protein
LAGKTVADAVSAYGASVKPKLANIAISGAPEDQLRGPLESLIKDLAEIGGLSAGAIELVGETTLSELKTRPDFAVIASNALIPDLHHYHGRGGRVLPLWRDTAFRPVEHQTRTPCTIGDLLCYGKIKGNYIRN